MPVLNGTGRESGKRRRHPEPAARLQGLDETIGPRQAMTNQGVFAGAGLAAEPATGPVSFGMAAAFNANSLLG